MAGRASLGSQHRLLGGGPPYQSPTIPLFSQSQGYYQQPPAGSMSLLGRSPYMGTINRATMPPPNGLQQGPGPAGSTPTLAFQVCCRLSIYLDIGQCLLVCQHQTLFRNDQSPPDRKRQRMTTPNPADHQLQQPQSQSQSQPQQPQHLQQQSQSQPLPLQQSQQAPQPSQQGQHQLSMAPIGPLSSDLQPVTGVGSVQGIPMIGAPGPSQAPSGSGAPPTHQMSQLNIPLNPAGSASMSTPLLNSAPLSNPQPPPPTASAPLPTPTPPPPAAGPEPITDLLLDMSEMSSNGDADSDFDPDILDDLELWFDPTDVDDDDSFLDMVITKPRFDPIRKSDPWLDPIVMHDGPSLDTT